MIDFSDFRMKKDAAQPQSRRYAGTRLWHLDSRCSRDGKCDQRRGGSWISTFRGAISERASGWPGVTGSGSNRLSRPVWTDLRSTIGISISFTLHRQDVGRGVWLRRYSMTRLYLQRLDWGLFNDVVRTGSPVSLQQVDCALLVKGIQSCAMTSYPETFFLTISYPTTQAHRAGSANSKAMIPLS
jgi:hypothetical protein